MILKNQFLKPHFLHVITHQGTKQLSNCLQICTRGSGSIDVLARLLDTDNIVAHQALLLMKWIHSQETFCGLFIPDAGACKCALSNALDYIFLALNHSRNLH